MLAFRPSEALRLPREGPLQAAPVDMSPALLAVRHSEPDVRLPPACPMVVTPVSLAAADEPAVLALTGRRRRQAELAAGPRQGVSQLFELQWTDLRRAGDGWLARPCGKEPRDEGGLRRGVRHDRFGLRSIFRGEG